NSDYSATAATFAIGAGDGASADITVSATQDQSVEGTESFSGQTLTVGGPATASGSGQTITVNDDDSATLTFTSSSSSVGEGAGKIGRASWRVRAEGVAGGGAVERRGGGGQRAREEGT